MVLKSLNGLEKMNSNKEKIKVVISASDIASTISSQLKKIEGCEVEIVEMKEPKCDPLPPLLLEQLSNQFKKASGKRKGKKYAR